MAATGKCESTTHGRPKSTGKKFAAAAIGTVVEWFDFAIYAYSASAISAHFFPKDSGSAAMIGTFAIFGVAFVVRPLGAMLWGHLGDRIGRKKVLAATIMSMGLSTALIGVLPTYGQIGIIAPVLLLLCRLGQGVAAAGEAVGAGSLMLEHAPARRRGFWVGSVTASTSIASVFGAFFVLLVNTSTGDEYQTWGWRIPFLFGGLIMLVGLYIRRFISDGDAFQELSRTGKKSKLPLVECIREHPKKMFVVFIEKALQSLATYTLLAYFVTYTEKSLGLDSRAALVVNGLAVLALTIQIPLFSLLSDRIGRRPVILGGSVAIGLLCVPAYLLSGVGGSSAALAGQLLLTPGAAAMLAAGASLTVEIFPTNVRFSGGAVSYNLGYALLGGSAPMIGELLVSKTGSLVAPAYYMLAVSVLVIPILWKLLPETAHLPLLRAQDDNGEDRTVSRAATP